MRSQPQTEEASAEAPAPCCPPRAGDGLYRSYGTRAHEYLAELCGCARRLMRPAGPAAAADGAIAADTLAPALPAPAASVSARHLAAAMRQPANAPMLAASPVALGPAEIDMLARLVAGLGHQPAAGS